MYNLKKIGSKLSCLRAKKSLSVEDVSKITNIPVNVVRGAEIGECTFTPREQLTICDLYNVCWSTLFTPVD